MNPASPTSMRRRAIDDLDRAIVDLSARIDASTYELLVLIREFDERAGFLQWGLESCAEWLHWRCDLSLSAAREKVRATHALKCCSRDGGCAFPGCTHTRFVDAHHVRHWLQGGETSLDNLLLLCSSHHRLVHEGGYAIVRDYQGKWYFRRPDGRAIPEQGYRPEDVTENPSAEGWAMQHDMTEEARSSERSPPP